MDNTHLDQRLLVVQISREHLHLAVLQSFGCFRTRVSGHCLDLELALLQERIDAAAALLACSSDDDNERLDGHLVSYLRLWTGPIAKMYWQNRCNACMLCMCLACTWTGVQAIT